MKEYFDHYSGLKAAKDGEIFVPQNGPYPAHYTYGSENKYKEIHYKGKHRLVHRIVAEVFLNDNKPIPKDHHVHHINGDKWDNRVENLVILTHEEHERLHNNGKHHTEEHKKKISNALKGKTVSEETRKKISETNKGKKRTDEQRRKMSEARKGKYVGADSPCFGKHPSEETRRKMSENRKGKMLGEDNHKSKSIVGVNLTTGEMMKFSCAREAERILGIKQSNISKCCNGIRKKAGNFKWYFE